MIILEIEKARAEELLEKHNQKHLLMFYNKMNDENRKKLINEISNVDFSLMENLYNSVGKEEKNNKKIEPIEYIDKYKLDEETFNKYKKIGEEVLKQGKLAVITMAGGQGTRLRT